MRAGEEVKYDAFCRTCWRGGASPGDLNEPGAALRAIADPAPNAVSLEDEMMKVSANQGDYAAVTALYSRSLGLLKTAIGKR